MDLINSFAIVAYLGGPVARFAERLREELIPGSAELPHVTVLRPRPLARPAAEAVEFARELVARFDPFSVETGAVEWFPSTQVIYLSLRSGAPELAAMHGVLNTGPLEDEEEFPYVPHITLAKGLDAARFDACLETSRRRWQEFGPAAPLRIDTLTFVQQRLDGSWTDLAELGLGRVPAVG